MYEEMNNDEAVSSIYEDNNPSNSSIRRLSEPAGGPSNNSSLQEEPFNERDIRNYAPHRICHCNAPAPTTESMTWHVNKDLKQRLFKCKTCEKYSFQIPEKPSKNKQDQFQPCKTKTWKNFYRKSTSYPDKNIFFHKRLYSCNVCNKWFIKQSSIAKHLKYHEAARVHDCNLCEKSFLNKSALKSHISCHKEEKTFRCLECGKMYTRKSYLSEHRYVHTREKRFICHLCGKKYLYKNSLTSHLLVHEGEKRYECDICKMKFVNRHHLYLHLRIHSDIKRFECDICKKHFLTKMHVETHLLVHFGEKIYNCQLCDKCFSYKGSLRTHYLQVHSLNKTEYEWITDVNKNKSLNID